MIILARLIVIVPLLSGCGYFYGPYNNNRTIDPATATIYGVPDAEVVVRQPQVYTRSEVDAINAEITCRSLARNPLEIQRCGVRR